LAKLKRNPGNQRGEGSIRKHLTRRFGNLLTTSPHLWRKKVSKGSEKRSAYGARSPVQEKEVGAKKRNCKNRKWESGSGGKR